MKKFKYFTFFTIILPWLSIGVVSDDFSDKWSDGWKVHTSEDMVVVSTNGNFVHGDRFRVLLQPKSKKACNIASQYTSFMSAVDDIDKKFDSLPSKYIVSKINNKEESLMKIETTFDAFGKSKIAWFDFSTNKIEDFLDYHSGNEEIGIELLAFYDFVNKKILSIDISEYFDVTKNSWSLDGIETAIYKGKSDCLMLVK